MRYQFISAAALVSTLALGPTACWAQDGGHTQQNGDQLAAEDVGPEKAEAFARVFVGIREKVDEYQPKITAVADDQQKSEQLRSELQSEMVQVIESEEEISIQDYNTIIAAMRQDDAIRQKIDQAILKLRERDSSPEG